METQSVISRLIHQSHIIRQSHTMICRLTQTTNLTFLPFQSHIMNQNLITFHTMNQNLLVKESCAKAEIKQQENPSQNVNQDSPVP